MLATQVQYWANQEQKRHNLVQEANQAKELTIAAQNAMSQERSSKASAKQADVAEMQANVGAVNALTQQRAIEINKMQAEAALSQAATASKMYELNALYRPQELYVQQIKADADTRKAEASIQQARAAALQADSAASLRSEEQKLKQAQTINTQLQNDFYAPVAGSKLTSTLVDVAKTISSLVTRKTNKK